MRIAAASRAWQALLFVSLGYATVISILHLLHAYPRHRVESGWLIFGALFLATALTRFGGAAGTSRATVDRRVLLLTVAAAAVLYVPSFTIGLLSDDYTLLALSERWDLVPRGWEHFRPLTLAIWALLSIAGLASPVLLHGLNIALHGVNAFLTYWLGREAGASSATALGAAALFLAFPGAVEPVSWLSGFQDVLTAALVLGFVISAIRNRPLIAFALLVAATFTKETAVCAPGLLLLMKTRRQIGTPILVASFMWSLLFAILRLYIKPAEDLFEPVTAYFLKELLVRIYGGLAMPWMREQMSAYAWLMLAILLSLAMLFTLIIHRRRDKPLWTIASVWAAWSLLAALPVYRYFYVSPDLQGARYLYLPSVGWSLLVAFLALERRQLAGRLAAALIAVAGVAGVFMHQGRWRAAAEYRDQVLAQAMHSADAHGCRNPEFTSGPDAYRGVYVFRNGLNEAMDRARPRDPAVAADCRFDWKDDAFVLKAARE